MGELSCPRIPRPCKPGAGDLAQEREGELRQLVGLHRLGHARLGEHLTFGERRSFCCDLHVPNARAGSSEIQAPSLNFAATSIPSTHRLAKTSATRGRCNDRGLDRRDGKQRGRCRCPASGRARCVFAGLVSLKVLLYSEG